MAFNPDFKFSMQNEAGAYYFAELQNDASWYVNVIPVFDPRSIYVEVLPDGWDKTEIMYERDMSYIGIFRSMSSNGAYKFSMDCRAILQDIYKREGVQGYCKLTIWSIKDDWTYEEYYSSQIDFTGYSDQTQNELLEVHTLDNGLIRDIHAYGNSAVNTPMWNYDPTIPGWVPNDTEFMIHDGMKLLYSASYISSASATSPVQPTFAGSPIPLYGFNHGSVSDGRHWLPAMSNYSVVQNNGTTTFIGNDILNLSLLQKSQSLAYEQTFWGTNDSRPYSRDAYLLKDILVNSAGNVSMEAVLQGTIVNPISYANLSIYNNMFIGIVLFEIDETDHPVMSGGNMQYIPVLKIYLPNNGSPYNIDTGTTTIPASSILDANGNFSAKVPVTVNFNKCYVVGVILDDDITGISGFSLTSGPPFTSLSVTFNSEYNSGSAAPVAAPSLPASLIPFFRINTLMGKIVKALATRNTDAYGFPVPVATDYTFKSDYLSNPALPAVGDVVPYQTIITSAYCIHNLEGQSYVTLSLNDGYDFCKKIHGCGATIEYDINGNPNIFRVEDMAYFFQNTLLLDLAYDIVDEEITPLTEGLGANLKLGFAAQDLNSDFGTEVVISESYYNTPLSNLKGEMDYQESNILCEPYAIEKIRAQRVSQPIGATYTPYNPSSDNQTIALYIQPSPTVWTGTLAVPNPAYPNVFIVDPSNLIQPSSLPGVPAVFQLQTYPTAQNSDPSASANPYIYGTYYPDTYPNIPLSPCRIFERGSGALLHSVLDSVLDAESLTFRNTYVMQYNNTTAAVTGIASNLKVGAGATPVVEFADKKIGDLPGQLFRPILLKVRTRYPVNMFKLIKSGPNGYIQYKVKGKGYEEFTRRGFIYRVKQTANLQPNEFYLLATNDTVL